MSTTTLRCRRIRFKSGGCIELLHQPRGDIADSLRKTIASITSFKDSELVGYAVVAWRANGTVVPAFLNGPRSPLLAGQVPQYAKDCLLAELGVRWSKDD